ncbi:MAG: hypothetical protein QOJ57_1108, partial [Thermoleophilaceae bacterium]|nr:hypothetical protein [Thermoleophilaceae bacterium]
PLLVGVLQPARLSGTALAVALVELVGLAMTLIVTARGFEEPARVAARQIAEAQEQLRRARSGEQLTMASFRTRLPSLTGRTALAGERALAYRSFVQQRRMILPGMLVLGFALDVGVPALLLSVAPDFTWGWAALGIAGAWISGASMLAVELEHHHLRLAPLRPLPALLWLAAVPATHRAVSTELAWLLMLFVPGLSASVWLVGALLIPCLVALVEGAGTVAVVAADRLLPRALLRAALGLGGAIPAAALFGVAIALGVPAIVAGVVAAAALLAAAWSLFTFSARQIWPRRPLANAHR